MEKPAHSEPSATTDGYLFRHGNDGSCFVYSGEWVSPQADNVLVAFPNPSVMAETMKFWVDRAEMLIEANGRLAEITEFSYRLPHDELVAEIRERGPVLPPDR